MKPTWVGRFGPDFKRHKRHFYPDSIMIDHPKWNLSKLAFWLIIGPPNEIKIIIWTHHFHPSTRIEIHSSVTRMHFMSATDCTSGWHVMNNHGTEIEYNAIWGLIRISLTYRLYKCIWKYSFSIIRLSYIFHLYIYSGYESFKYWTWFYSGS